MVVPPHRSDARGEVPYPAGGEGDAAVVLIVTVSAEGAVTDVAVKSGAPPFSEAAAAAARSWLFNPATRDEVPVASRISVRIEFHAPPPPPPAPTTPTAPTAESRPASAPTGPAQGSPSAAEATEVVSVHAEREEPGTNHIPRTDSRFVPGAFADPFRAVETLPGMAPWLSGLPYYYVRGAPPESIGYAIDGVRVPLLFHVGLGPSVLSPPLVDTVDLFPGPYPARYGRFTGGMITGETTRPNMDEAHAQAGARAFDANVFAEVPFDGGKGSAAAAGRYGYTGALTKLVAPDYGVGYWDYQARVAHKTWGEDTVSAFAFGAHDELTYRGLKFYHVEFHRVDVRYDHPLADGNLRAAVTLSADDAFTAEQPGGGPLGPGAALRGPGGRARLEWERKLSSDVRARAGADVGAFHFDVDQSGGAVRGAHTDVVGGAHADVVWRPDKRVELVPGLRADVYATRTGTRAAPQPRLAARLRVTREVAWVSAFGVSHQEPTEEVFVPAKLPDPIEQTARDGYHLSEGVEVRLPERVRLQTSAFATRISAPAILSAERAYGGELFLRRDLSERLGGFLAYTLSRADRFVGPLVQRAPWDRTHLFSAALSYDLGRGFRIGARFFAESGRPYDVLCPTRGCTPGSTSVPSVPVSGTLPPFFRLDARLEKRWTFHGTEWVAVSLECFNATNASEPISATYAPASGLGIDRQSPVILPSVGLEAGF